MDIKNDIPIRTNPTPKIKTSIGFIKSIFAKKGITINTNPIRRKTFHHESSFKLLGQIFIASYSI